ncbi:MAG TPA: hypothetical protein V6C57_20955 [Coleofasciculaceae cyanobacterium]
MIWIDLAQLTPHFVPHFADVTSWHLGHGLLSGIGHWDMSHLAAFNTDVFANTRTFFNNFVKSGQAWALFIGLILGYVLRGFMTYG